MKPIFTGILLVWLFLVSAHAQQNRLILSYPEFVEPIIGGITTVLDPPLAGIGRLGNGKIQEGDSIFYFDRSSGTVEDRNWTFFGGNPYTASDSALWVRYDTAGNWGVELAVSNNGGSDQTTLDFAAQVTRPGNAPQVFLGDFFVDPSGGNDNNNGTSFSSPKATFASALALASPGDTIAIARGDTLFEEINLGKPVTILPYPYNGTEPAVLSGYETLSDWTDEGGGIYSATVSTRPITFYPNSLLIRGKHYRQGRKPETGFYNIDAVNTGSNYIDVSEVSELGLSTQAEAILRTSFRFFYSNINSISGDRVFYTRFDRRDTFQKDVEPEQDYGVAFTRDRALCDDFGEWAFDRNTNTLYVYFGDGGPVTALLSVLDQGIDIQAGGSGSTVDGLHIIGFNRAGLDTRNSDGNTIKNCRLANNEIGIDFSYSSNVVIRDNLIENSSTNAIKSEFGGQNNDGGVQIIGNTARNTHLWDQMIQTGAGGEPVFNVKNDNAVVDSNTLLNFGYVGINYLGSNIRVRYNRLDSGMLVLNDGGAIYCFENGDIDEPGMCFVENNTISNILGNFEGTKDNQEQAFGIYHDDGCDEHTVENNLITRVATAGLYPHNANRIFYTDNRITNCGRSAVFIFSHDDSNPTFELHFNGNYFQHGPDNELHRLFGACIQFVYSQSTSSVAEIWRGDNNIYCLNGADLAQCCSFGPAPTYDLQGWKAFTGDEANSRLKDEDCNNN